jgi:hypothetical protein
MQVLKLLAENAKEIKESILFSLWNHKPVTVDVTTNAKQALDIFRDMMRSHKVTPFQLMQNMTLVGAHRQAAIAKMHSEYLLDARV